jgi:bifunctional non-homologous end joining protein LigD
VLHRYPGRGDCVLDEQGRADFGELRRAIHSRAGRVFFAFDLLHLDGADLRREGLLERRARLQELVADADPTIRFSEAYTGDAAAFFRAASEHGLEGIVSKRVGSRYMTVQRAVGSRRSASRRPR